MTQDDNHNVHRQDGQGSWVFSLVVAATLAFHYGVPVFKDLTKDFKSFADATPAEKECWIYALARTPKAPCVFEKK